VADDRQNALARREILEAYVKASTRLGELVEVCSSVTGDVDQLRNAVQNAFKLSPYAAQAVLDMQVRRFTPHERQRILDELAELNLRLERIDGA
jgi:DNA gyrase/topoisomerase IV subunit A